MIVCGCSKGIILIIRKGRDGVDMEKVIVFQADVSEIVAKSFDALADGQHRSRKKQLEFLINQYVKDNEPDPDG